MSCRRVCRELLSFVRFGELGPRSQPHLDHLAGCASCRDEIGYDREMGQRLRMALAARIDGMDPSPQVWEHILRRAQAPDPEPEGWLGRLGAAAVRRRTTTAMAGTALALVLAHHLPVARSCTHVGGHGGAKAAVRSVWRHLPENRFVRKIYNSFAFSRQGRIIREGLAAVISLHHPDPQFESQTKNKLNNTEVKTAVQTAVGEALTNIASASVRSISSVKRLS